MQKVCVLRHLASGGPGYLAQMMARRGMTYEVVAIDQGQPLPLSLSDIRALVILGGPRSVRDEAPWIQEERQFILKALDAELPILAHSFGAELLAQAMGASIVHNVVHRIGWYTVDKHSNPTTETWLTGLPAQFDIFCWHDMAFSIPAGATAIMGSKWCVNDGFVYHNSLALQGHLEMTAEMVSDWLKRYYDQVYYPSNEVETADNLVVNWSSVVQGPDMITLNLPRRITALNRIADTLYGRWLDLVEQ